MIKRIKFKKIEYVWVYDNTLYEETWKFSKFEKKSKKNQKHTSKKIDSFQTRTKWNKSLTNRLKKETKYSSLNINEIKVETNKIKVFTKLNLQNVYNFIRLTIKKKNTIAFY